MGPFVGSLFGRLLYVHLYGVAWGFQRPTVDDPLTLFILTQD